MRSGLISASPAAHSRVCDSACTEYGRDASTNAAMPPAAPAAVGMNECAICMNELLAASDGGVDEPGSDGDAAGGSSREATSAKSATLILLPCGRGAATPHLFHADCLERWLLHKATCPACRHDVRPLLRHACAPAPATALPAPHRFFIAPPTRRPSGSSRTPPERSLRQQALAHYLQYAQSNTTYLPGATTCIASNAGWRAFPPAAATPRPASNGGKRPPSGGPPPPPLPQGLPQGLPPPASLQRVRPRSTMRARTLVPSPRGAANTGRPTMQPKRTRAPMPFRELVVHEEAPRVTPTTFLGTKAQAVQVEHGSVGPVHGDVERRSRLHHQRQLFASTTAEQPATTWQRSATPEGQGEGEQQLNVPYRLERFAPERFLRPTQGGAWVQERVAAKVPPPSLRSVATEHTLSLDG